MDQDTATVGPIAAQKSVSQYAAGCPMHVENHSDYIDPNNMVNLQYYIRGDTCRFC